MSKPGCLEAVSGFMWPSPFSEQSFFGSEMLLAGISVPLEKLEDSESATQSGGSCFKGLPKPLGTCVCCGARRGL